MKRTDDLLGSAIKAAVATEPRHLAALRTAREALASITDDDLDGCEFCIAGREQAIEMIAGVEECIAEAGDEG